MAEAQSKGAVGVTATLQGPPLPQRFSGKTLSNIYSPQVLWGGCLFTIDEEECCVSSINSGCYSVDRFVVVTQECMPC